MRTEEQHERQSALFNKYNVFFAFSQKQFDEKAVKGVKYCHINLGAICPKDNVDQFLKEFGELQEAFTTEILADNSKYDIINYELHNHECFYTGSIEDALDALDEYNFTREDVQEVYNKEREIEPKSAYLIKQ